MSDSQSLSNESPFAGYHLLSLPDLSTIRHPPSSRQAISVNIAADCDEKVVLVALARCLGAYSGSSDVLLAWHPSDRTHPRPTTSIAAARVNWSNSKDYQSVFDVLVLQETEDDLISIRNALQLDIDDGINPFLAVLSSNSNYNHPLIASLTPEHVLRITYSTRHFHQVAAEVLAKQVCAVAHRIVKNPGLSPKDLSFLPEDLLSIVPMVTEGSSYTHYPPACDVIEFVKRHDPNMVTIEYYANLYEEDPEVFERSTRYLTYGELDRRSNRFAAYLLAQGLQQEDRVTLCMPRGIEFHVALIGVLRAGGCYVPIDHELSEERKRFINEDSGARFALTAENIEEHIAASESYPDDDINNTRPEGLAYLLYTSGTTGTPKGCLLTHDGFAQAVHALSWFANQAGPNKRRWPQAGRYLCVASVAFDVHLAEIFVALSLGMTIITASRTQVFEDLPRWLDRLRISHVGIVPSLIEATMHAVHESAELAADGNAKGKVMDLAYIASGGEKMSDAILDRWADHPLVTLANFYGPSETTIGCSARLMTSATRKENVGRIFESCSAYIVDENLNLVVRGGMGELLVGGRLVGRGYHNRPDLTEKAFVQFSHGSHRERVYRTGDLARLMPDDTMEIIGRIDTQIKLRGVRIESEGISAVIRNAAAGFPGLSSKAIPDVSTILARHPQLKADQLVSFIGLDFSKSISERRTSEPRILDRVPLGLMRTLKEACTRDLASYMRPAHLILLDFLPLNQNGKTDNKVLGTLFQSESMERLVRASAEADVNRMNGEDDTHAYSRPLSEAETRVAEIVARYTEVKHDQLSSSSNLFQLGFDSFKLVRLASDLRSLIDARTVSIGSIIQNPTIEEIASLLDSVRSTGRKSSQSYVNKFSQEWRREVEENYGVERIEGTLPTFPVQDGVLYRSADLKTLYVQHVLLRLHDDVDIEKLKNAWTALMSEHEILRTVFYYSSSLVQVVLKPGACDLPWNERGIGRRNVQEVRSSFFEEDAIELAQSINENLTTIPPFRLVLFHADDQGAPLLSLSIHHALYDGVSLPLLFQDVQALHHRESPRPFAPPAEVLDAIYDVGMNQAATFWRKMFAGFDWSQIPKRVASGETANAVSRTFQGSLHEWERKAAETKVSLQAVLTAAFGLCLGEQLYGVSDVVFGVIRSGRSFTDERLDNARVPLLTVVPTRVNNELGADLLRSVQHDIGAILAFEHLPLSRIQTWLQPGRPLFEVLFSVSIDEGSKMDIWDVLESKQPQADYILAVEAILDKTTGQVRIDCGFTDPLSHQDATSILEEFEKAATSLAEGVIRNDRKNRLNINFLEESTDEASDDEDIPDEFLDAEFVDKIRSIVAQFLKIDASQVSSTSSLIALGLDSIKAVGISRTLRKEGIEVRSLDIMRRPTVRFIASRYTRSQKSQETRTEEKEAEKLLAENRARIASSIDAAALKLDETDEVQLFPTTVLQAGMLSQTISSGGHLYVHAFPFELKQTVDINHLCVAWERTLQYYSILRTTFHFAADIGTWVQAVHSSHVLHWDETKVHEENAILPTTEEFIQTLDFSSQDGFAKPPVHLRLLHQSRNGGTATRTLVLVLHHALYDGISFTRLSEIVRKFYQDEEPYPSPQFVDLLGYFAYQELHGAEYWTRQLRGFDRQNLPRKTHSVSQLDSFSATLKIPVPAERMREACQRFEVTVQCFGQASFAELLAKVYSRRDIVFGHVVSGRNIPNAEDVLGPMISTVPYRARISRTVNALDFVRSIHRQNMVAQRWQHASLRSIQRSVGLSSLWDAIFLFQPIIDDDANEEDLWSFPESDDEVAKIQYPLNIELHQHGSHLLVRAACQSSYFSKDDLDSMVNDFAQTLIKIIDEPSDCVLPHLAFDEEQHATINGNGHQFNGVIGHVRLTHDARISKFIAVLSTCLDTPVDSIHLDTPFISLGIDSITAIQISSKARESGLRLHPADILRCRVPEDIVAILDIKSEDRNDDTKANGRLHEPLSKQRTREAIRYLGAPEELVESVLPAMAGMEWLIGMWQKSNRERFQHVFAFELPNDVDEELLKSAWTTLTQKHPILRSTFFSSTGEDVHIVTFKSLAEERLWSRRQETSEQLSELVKEVAEDLVSNPLSTDLPPCRAVFVSTARSKAFILHLHHFQYDAWSLPLLVSDLDRLYKGNEVVFKGDLSLLETCNSPRLKEQQIRYWKEYLPSPSKASLFPKLVADRAGNRVDRLCYIDYDALRCFRRLRQRAQELSVSLNAVFLASWAQVQAKYSALDSATFGLWHLGRSGIVDDVDSLAFPCMNVLPLHLARIGTSVIELANSVHAALRQRSSVVEQSHLVDVDRWTGGDGNSVKLNVFVNIVTNEGTEDVTRGKMFNPIRLPHFIPKFEGSEPQASTHRLAICNLLEDAILIDFGIAGENITMSIEYRSDYLDEETSRGLVTEWAHLVEETLK